MNVLHLVIDTINKQIIKWRPHRNIQTMLRLKQNIERIQISHICHTRLKYSNVIQMYNVY